MGVKLGLSLKAKNVGGGCSRIGYCGTLLGLKRKDVTGDWRRMNSEELYGFTAYQILYG